jgi:hypothetical protein
LDDFNEDARVELEIGIADEECVARRYATLLALLGEIVSAVEAQDVEGAVCAFIESGDTTVARAQVQVPSSLSLSSRPATPDHEHTPPSNRRALKSWPSQLKRLAAEPCPHCHASAARDKHALRRSEVCNCHLQLFY